MKFSSSFSALLVVLPLIANVSGLAVPEDRLISRQRQGGGRGGQAAAAQQAAAAKAAQQAAAAKATAAKAGNNGAAAGAGAATGNNAAAGGNAATGGNNGGNAAATDAKASQTALTLNPAVIQTTDDGQNPPVTGQTAAATSPNNFANFCALGLPKTPITNGLQTTTGSCNPIPIGQIPGTNAIPSAKFQSPTNGDTIAADKAFTITLAAKNIQLGTFTNAQKTYFANPQTLNGQGQIIGHTHVVIEAIDSLGSTKVTDPTKFFFFKGVDAPANGQGQVTVDVTTGVPAGTYRMGTIMSSATHQPVIVPIAQHGLCDDVVYFTATAGGVAAGGNNAGNAAAGAANNAGAAAGQAAAGQAAAGGNGKGGNKGAAAAAGQGAAAAGAATAANGAAAAGNGAAAAGTGAAAAGTAATAAAGGKKGGAGKGAAAQAAATQAQAGAAQAGAAQGAAATAAKGATKGAAQAATGGRGGRGGKAGRSRL